MWEGYYGKEPFDLRLTLLRLLRSLGWILCITLLGTILFGGGYYVKNVLLGEKPRYEQTITCKLEYTNPPVQSGDYYINEMTWNTYVNSDMFWELLRENVSAAESDSSLDAFWADVLSDRADVLTARVASDIHVPSFTVSCLQEGQTDVLSRVLQTVLTGPFAESVPELASVQVVDVSDAVLVYPDVRPLRAVILSALLSCFFAVVFFLLREIGADSVWLPATLRRRYGLPAAGTIYRADFVQNAGYLCRDRKRMAVCSTEDGTDLQNVTKALQEKLQGGGRTWEAVPSPLYDPASTEKLRQADGVWIVVPAGLHAGKKLEYLLEFMRAQEIEVTAALLWEADEWLIGSYYFLPGGRK